MTQPSPDPTSGRVENAADLVTPGEAVTSNQLQALDAALQNADAGDNPPPVVQEPKPKKATKSAKRGR